MKNSELVAVCLACAVVGFMGAMIYSIPIVQSAYTEGRDSVLSKPVKVGGSGDQCSVMVPLSVLAEMVEVGVLDWHELCKDKGE